MVLETDVCILGGGTGGYVAAIKAARKGKKVVLIEKDKLGGTCLNRGCIPTKSYLRSAEICDQVKAAEGYGVELDNFGVVNFGRIFDRKNAIVAELHQSIVGLMEKHKIKVLHGVGKIQGPSSVANDAPRVLVTFPDSEDENVVVSSKNLLLATGSSPKTVPGIELDEKNILSSDGMLTLESLPKSIGIIGGGAVGVEFASILNSLGTKVSIFELTPKLLVDEAKSVSMELLKQFEQRGIDVNLSTVVQKAISKNKQVVLSIKDQADQIFDKVLVAVGRKPNVTNLGLEKLNIKFDQTGISVDEYYQTAEPHVYAIWDCIPKLQLAHVAMKEGEIAVDHFTGTTVAPLNYESVPRCIYTDPEIACVGYNRNNVPAKYNVAFGSFPFSSNGKALVEGNQVGFVELLRDKRTDELLGASIIGPHATELITELSAAIAQKTTVAEVAAWVYPRPTLSETIGEAALDTFGLAVHK